MRCGGPWVTHGEPWPPPAGGLERLDAPSRPLAPREVPVREAQRRTRPRPASLRPPSTAITFLVVSGYIIFAVGAVIAALLISHWLYRRRRLRKATRGRRW
jgi:hypothetical protein